MNALPTQRSTNEGGTKEYAEAGELFRHFKQLSNELAEPKLLVCPADTRKPGRNFSTIANANASYFVSMDKTEVSGGFSEWMNEVGLSSPRIMLGDRNLTNSSSRKGGIAAINKTQAPGWSAEMHNHTRSRTSLGNAAIMDGSVSNLTSSELQPLFNFNVPTWLAFP